MGHLRKMLTQVKEGDAYKAILEGAIPYAELNDLIAQKAAAASQ